MKIGKYEIEKPIVLAPMEGITDLPFRIVCRRMGADLVYSEFISSEGLVRDAKKSLKKLEVADEERPVAVQIFGSSIESMIRSAKIVESAGADILDINFGCWVRKVVGNNAGAAFLKDPKKMAEMTKAVVESVSIPVTVKTRLGWDKSSINILEAVSLLSETSIAAVAVHCRTRDMGMSGDADWSWVSRLKQSTNLPIILNGDVKSAEDAKRAFELTGCDGVMIGRAAIGNPFIFKEAKRLITDGGKASFDLNSRIETCLDHLRLSVAYNGLPWGVNEFRKYYSGYFKGYYNGSNLRQKLVTLDSYDAIAGAICEYYDELRRLGRLEDSIS